MKLTNKIEKVNIINYEVKKNLIIKEIEQIK